MYAQIEWNPKIGELWGLPSAVDTWMTRRNTPSRTLANFSRQIFHVTGVIFIGQFFFVCA